MFTGIVEELGTVVAAGDGRLEVVCSTVARGVRVGDSIAVSGVCLSAVDHADGRLAFDLSAETLRRTTLGDVAAGSEVNLERPVTLAARMGGHLVQGHVDGVGTVGSVEELGDGGSELTVRLPDELTRYVVEKGSIAIDGVSLTVARVEDDGVRIALIPHTRAATTLGSLAAGERVNIEVDVLARYVERLIERTGR